MRNTALLAMAALCATLPTLAHADDAREFCADRPGKATPACTLDPGKFQAETSVADWTLDKQDGTRTDTILGGDLLLRMGLTDTVEARLGWTPYGHVRMRDASGAVTRQSGTGDVTLGFRKSLLNPDGSGTSIAFQPTVTIPTGGQAIGAGTWGVGVVVPVSFSLGRDVQLGFSPEIDATPDMDRSGRHVTYAGVAALSVPVTKTITGTAEIAWENDHDPSGHTDSWTLDLVAAWQPKSLKDVQFDVGGYVGLNHDAPDVQILGGIAKRF